MTQGFGASLDEGASLGFAASLGETGVDSGSVDAEHSTGGSGSSLGAHPSADDAFSSQPVIQCAQAPPGSTEGAASWRRFAAGSASGSQPWQLSSSLPTPDAACGSSNPVSQASQPPAAASQPAAAAASQLAAVSQVAAAQSPPSTPAPARLQPGGGGSGGNKAPGYSQGGGVLGRLKSLFRSPAEPGRHAITGPLQQRDAAQLDATMTVSSPSPPQGAATASRRSLGGNGGGGGNGRGDLLEDWDADSVEVRLGQVIDSQSLPQLTQRKRRPLCDDGLDVACDYYGVARPSKRRRLGLLA